MLYSLFFRAEIVLADAAEFAGEIFGEIFPLDALFFLIVDPAADVANVLHFVLPPMMFIRFGGVPHCLLYTTFHGVKSIYRVHSNDNTVLQPSSIRNRTF